MSLYPETKKWLLPSTLLSHSLEIMYRDGKAGCEGIAFWLGTQEAGAATVRAVVAIDGYGIQKHPLYIEVTPDAMNALADAAELRGQYLIGQIHSHPGTFTDLSDTDIRYGVSSPYYLSAVAPHYAADRTTKWLDCGIHIFFRQRGFVRLSRNEASRLIQVCQSLDLEFVELRE